MRARAIALSAGAHVLVGGITALAWRHASSPPPAHDDPVSIDLAPRATVVTPRDLAVLSPPTPRRLAAPTASHAAAHASPARKPTERAGPRSGHENTASGATIGEAHPTSTDVAALPAGDGAGSATTGGGDGDGSAATGGGVDHSARPVPIDASSARVLPYTEAALRDRISGDVVLVLHVDAQGAVTGAIVRKPLGHGLDEIAIDVARRFKFRPARDPSGAATAGDVAWRFHFAPP